MLLLGSSQGLIMRLKVSTSSQNRLLPGVPAQSLAWTLLKVLYELEWAKIAP